MNTFNESQLRRCGVPSLVRWLAGTAVSCAALSAGAQTVPVPEVLWYTFNESGTTVTNHASAPPAGTATATMIGAMTQNTAFSNSENALTGTGTSSTNDYVNTNWATNIVSDWTVMFATSNIPTTTSTFYILGDVNAGGFRCFTGGVAGPNNWILRGPITDVLSIGAADANPHTTAFVYDSTAGEIRAYKDGVLNNTVAQATGFLIGTGPFKVGGYSASANLPGKMADFRFYSRALSVAEIQAIDTYDLHSFTVGGTVTGTSGSGLTLQLNGANDLAIAADGNFQFATAVADAATYDVTVSASPAGQTCVVNNGSGTIATANVTDVAVSCGVSPSLVVTDGKSYAHYGETVPYQVVLDNSGVTTLTNIAVSSTASAGLDEANATWTCTATGGATCAATGTGAFADTVSLPPGSTLGWTVNIPVFAATTEDTVQFDVTAATVGSDNDVDNVVLFADGFEG